MIIKRSEKERHCPKCGSQLVYKGQSAVDEAVELWQCPDAVPTDHNVMVHHLNADGTQATPPPFPGRK